MSDSDNNIKLTVYPSGVDGEALTVSDAMRQVLDHFELLSKAEARDSTSNASVVWRLERASTNSPFTIEASPRSSNPELSVDRQALNARNSFFHGLSSLYRGESKPAWLDRHAEEILRRILVRNLNGIARTDVAINAAEPPIILDHRAARRVQNYLDLKSAEEAALVEDLSRAEYGSIRGQVIGISTHYKKPALRMRERLSGAEVKCVLQSGDAETIGSRHQWAEVWNNRNIVVSGRCIFDKSGNLVLIEADDIEDLKNYDVSIADIRDEGFSAGLTPQEHLEKLWGDENG